MYKLCAIPALAMAFAVVITGCSNQTNTLFRTPSAGPLNAAAPAVAPAPQAPVNPAAPYVLSAESAGPYIDFGIYNLGDTDLVVKRENFAILSPENRNVIPYSKTAAIIDLPQPAVVKPNSTLKGRAIFKEIKSPIGKRLVFKPDETGTFADINAASGNR